MPEPFSIVTKGQPLRIRAADWNRIIAGVKRAESQQGGAGDRTLRDNGNTVVYVKNMTGDGVPRFGILGIDEPLILPDDNELEFTTRVAFVGVLPRVASSSEFGHEGRLLITLEPINDGQIGRAVVSGAVQVKLDIQDEDDRFAEIIDENAIHLRTNNTSGIPILWIESGSSPNWGIVLLGGAAPAASGSSETFVARITANSQDGTNKRWTYTITEQSKAATGYDGYSATPGGLSGVTAYNYAEVMNGATGLFGNGVTSTNLTGTFDIKPIPTSRLVRVWTEVIVILGVTTTEYWFQAENGVDGAC